jgi:hypothetical protein
MDHRTFACAASTGPGDVYQALNFRHLRAVNEHQTNTWIQWIQ